MDEQQFKKIIIKIRALAKSQGESISREQVKEHFIPLDIEEGQFLLVYKYLEEEKVTLYETEEERQNAQNEASASGIIEDNKVKVNGADSEYLKMYIDELNSLDIPGKDDRHKILTEVLDNKERAADILPNLYLKEVIDIARLYSGQGVPLEDLVGEGNIGVLMGIKMLDVCETPQEVDEFIVKMIMESMESIIMEDFSAGDFDVKVLERVNELNDRARDMAEDLERLVSVEELARELEMDEEYIRETIRLSGNAISYIEECKR